MGDLDGLDLGRFGIYTFDFEHQPAARMRESVQELEDRGWPAFWIPELAGREAFTHAGYLLSCTRRITVVNGIAQIWSREAPGRTAPRCSWPTPTPGGTCWAWGSAACRGRGSRRWRRWPATSTRWTG
ncbi:hypothetical protein GCM10027612_49290 [Microbispora bryophytorum subsp. camponoti]